MPAADAREVAGSGDELGCQMIRDARAQTVAGAACRATVADEYQPDVITTPRARGEPLGSEPARPVQILGAAGEGVVGRTGPAHRRLSRVGGRGGPGRRRRARPPTG